jgi:hypothetical protein
MTTQAAVNDFVSQKRLAIVGVSRKKAKFGNYALRELRRRGYQLFPVHPEADTIEGETCFRSLKDLPEPVGGLLVVVPPAATETVVREAAAAGIPRIWIQQGAESPAAVKYCEENGIAAVHGECILMFTQPTGWLHGAHRWVWKLLGKLPT